MRTMGVFLATPISEMDLREFVVRLGGEWREDFGIRQGIIARDGGQILLTLENDVIQQYSTDEDPPWPREAMKFDPKSQVVIGVIRYHVPEQDRAAHHLARDVASQLSEKWNGFVDWDEVAAP